MSCCPAGDGRGRDADEIGDGPLHVLLPYGDAVGADGRHLLQRPGEFLPPRVRQLEVVLEDRVVGQDRRIDAHRQLRPVGGAAIDGVVDGQEDGPVAVEVAESVLGIEGAVPQLPRRLVLRRGHQPQPNGHTCSGAGRDTQGAPGPPQNSPPGSTWTSRAFAVCAWRARMRCSVSGSGEASTVNPLESWRPSYAASPSLRRAQ